MKMGKILELSRAQKAPKTTWGPVPPRDIVQGALMDLWRECWQTVTTYKEISEKPVDERILKRVNGSVRYGRNVEIATCLGIIQQHMREVWIMLGDVNPACLTPGHRKARALGQQWHELPPLCHWKAPMFGKQATVMLMKALRDVPEFRKYLLSAVQSGSKRVRTQLLPNPTEPEAVEVEAEPIPLDTPELNGSI